MMDTPEVVDLNCSFRSYEKVKEAEHDQEFRRATKRRIATIVVSLILLVGIVVALSVIFVVNRKGKDGRSSSQGTRTGPDLIALVCSMTSHPKSCYDSISAIAGGVQVKDPKTVFKLSLDVANAELSKFSNFSRMLAIGANNSRVRGALEVCTKLIVDSGDRLNESASLVDPERGVHNLTRSSINDITTWISAALTNLETCLDGFEGTNSVLEDVVANMINKGKDFISNSLAIAVNSVATLKDLGVPLHRKLLTTGRTEPDLTWVRSHSWGRRLFREDGFSIPDATVARDGSGQFKTIGAAMAAAPTRNPKPYVIYVKGGRYVERVIVDKDKWNIVMFGDGAHKTIITSNGSFADGIPTFDTSTFAVEGRGFVAKDMGFENSAGPRSGPAVAVRSNSDRSIFYRCAFYGYENTLYALSLRQFFRDCEIRGTVDFIFGNAAVVFQNCTIQPTQPLRRQTSTILAQGRSDRYQNTATSIHNCTIRSLGNVTARTYLGRPWKSYATAVVMRSDIGLTIDPSGWWAGDRQGNPPPTLFFGEYGNFGLGSGTTGRVRWTGYRPNLSEEEAHKFLLGPLVDGEEWIPNKGILYSWGL